ncbi:hypothetical protein SMICM304S_11383 [Streptomyces microflavus]
MPAEPLHDFDPTASNNEEALLHLERAVDLCPPDDPMRGDLLNQLAHATIVRDDRSRPTSKASTGRSRCSTR